MRCPECGGEINENEVFCPGCGAELFGVPAEPVEAEHPDIAEETDTENPKKKKGKNKDKKGASQNGKSKKQKMVITLRIVLIVLLAALVVFIIFVAADSVSAAKGRKIFDKVPLGRNIDIIESDTGANFLEGKVSEYGAVNNCISDYKYICESENEVNVNGTLLPEWAVLLNADDSGSVYEATLYNFSVLKHSWMGARTAGRIEPSTVEFGMTAKAAERALGLKPYSIKKESTGNTSVYVYRYNYTDTESGNISVRNFFVEVSDVDGKVKSAYDDELDYLNLMLAVHGGSIAV
ncbi:MAG: zinc ribbon domain-containing protein [Oscillospiraceae bacterium]|nr:zinc ribbon domain-containing protein [Oscillospiraceae bacterium]